MESFIKWLDTKIDVEFWSYMVLIMGTLFSALASVALGTKNSMESKKLSTVANNLETKTNLISNKTLEISNSQSTLQELNQSLALSQAQLTNLTDSLLDNEKRLKEITSELKLASFIEFEKNSTTGTIEGFKINPAKTLTIHLGGMTKYIQPKDITDKITLINDPLIQFEYFDNQLFLTTTISTIQGQVLFDVYKNNWLASNNILHKNWDEKGVEIIDVNNFVVLKIDVVKENYINMAGLFFTGTASFLVSDSSIRYNSYNSPGFVKAYLETVSEIKPIFKHHGKNIFKERL